VSIFVAFVHNTLAYHAEGLAYPKVLAKKTVTDLGKPRACRLRKHQNIIYFQFDIFLASTSVNKSLSMMCLEDIM
jgi:hypothetical protein